MPAYSLEIANEAGAVLVTQAVSIREGQTSTGAIGPPAPDLAR
jgi:hypothetical protein